MTLPQNITVLGATGSVGSTALDVIAQHPDKYQIFALSGYSRLTDLLNLCLLYKPNFVVVPSDIAASEMRTSLRISKSKTEVLIGESGLCEVSSDISVSIVVAAIMGSVGLKPIMSAASSGKKILLANKEALVMAGSILMKEAARNGSLLLPIDSEHNAIFQCLPEYPIKSLHDSCIRQVILTASGGPFWRKPPESLINVTAYEACVHPTWSMGRKISIDSATMMNKGLEIIEAMHLFNANPSAIQVIIHPQSIVHSFVEYIDGSTLAQMSHPDMRIPIAYALAWPKRIHTASKALDLVSMASLEFYSPEENRFPCLRLAREAANTSASAPVILNAANEVVVQAFIDGRIDYLTIPRIIEDVLQEQDIIRLTDLDTVLSVNLQTRILTEEKIRKIS